VKGGRSLWPVGTWGGRIILQASLPVVADPTGKQEGDHDDEFLAWDPVANTFQLLWSNVSRRSEGVWSSDGNWALSELAGFNPFSQWELRLHNMATGEVRTVDAQDPATRDAAAGGLLDSRLANGRVLWVTVVSANGQYVEQLRMLTIATGETTIIDSAPLVPPAPSSFDPGGVNGDTVAYLRGAPGPGRTVVMRSISTGVERDVAAPPGTIWEAISPDVRFAVARQDPPPTIGSGPEGPRLAVNLATGEIRRFAEGQSYGFGVDFADGYISWQVLAGDNAVNGFFSLTSGLTRIMDASVHVDGQGARVFDGWYSWRERAPGSTAANNDRTKDILRFMRLP